MHSILLISWDPAVRSESEPFAWAEMIVQTYKDYYPELYLDYIDLHQDIFSFPLDSDMQMRLDQAQLICIVLNDEWKLIPATITTLLGHLARYDWLAKSKFIFTQKDQAVFATWSQIDSRKKLVEALAFLKKEAEH